jgi:hypothetical protein
MGRVLAEMSTRILHSLRFTSSVPLDWRLRRLRLPYREIPPRRQQEVADILSRQPHPPRGDSGEVDPRWFLAASTRSVELCRRREPRFPYEVQVLRLGDTAVVGLPGEPFVEGQLAIKTTSPAPFCFVAHLTTQYVGYLPTREAYARGGHEANAEVTYWAKLAPGCLETVVAKARELVGELFPGGVSGWACRRARLYQSYVGRRAVVTRDRSPSWPGSLGPPVASFAAANSGCPAE